MNSTDRRPIWRSISMLSLLLTAVSGCAEMELPSWSPWSRQADTHPGVIPPAQRMVELKELAKNPNSISPEQRGQIASRLASAYETEENPMLRAEIVRTLGAYPSVKSDAVLQAAVNDPRSDVRIAACEAWSSRGDARAAEVLAEVLGSEMDSYVRLAAARGLGHTRGPTAVNALGEALADKDPALQRRAVLSLKEATGEDFGNDVVRWRQYVRGKQPTPPEPVSVADRFRPTF